MTVIVQKYGGTSVADARRIRAVAERVLDARRAGNDVCVVVSAMGDTTDELLAMAHRADARSRTRASWTCCSPPGERIAMSLLAIAINAAGFPAASYTGSQAGIITDTAHGKAKIIDIRPGRIREALDKGQHRDRRGVPGRLDRPTTSPRSAGAGRTPRRSRWRRPWTRSSARSTRTSPACSRPTLAWSRTRASSTPSRTRRCSSWRRPERRSCSSARWSTLGSHGVKVHVRSSFTDEPGTWITEEDVRMEQALISNTYES